jgi:hypothetical protein
MVSGKKNVLNPLSDFLDCSFRIFFLSIALSEIFWIALSENFFVKGVTP